MGHQGRSLTRVLYFLVIGGILAPAGVAAYGAWHLIGAERDAFDHRSTARERATADYVQRRAEGLVGVPLEALRKIAADPPFSTWERQRMIRALAGLEELGGVPVRARYL